MKPRTVLTRSCYHERQNIEGLPVKFGSLFSGIGGMDLGLERAGMECAWQVEINDYASKVLAKHWPAVRRFRDVRECGERNLEQVDLIAGGFPCQDISNAGKRAGIDGEQSGLWAEFYRIVCELRPRFVLVENVAALLERGIERVLGDLASCGYDAEWCCLPASAFGAPHERERVFIVAHADSERRDFSAFAQGRIRQIERTQFWESFRTANNALRVQEFATVCRVLDGLSAGVDGRLHAIGNAVVPQVAQWIGERILEAEAQNEMSLGITTEGQPSPASLPEELVSSLTE